MSWQISGHLRKSFPMWLERFVGYMLAIAKLHIFNSFLPPLECAGHFGKLFQPWGRTSYGSQTPVSLLRFPAPLIRRSWVSSSVQWGVHRGAPCHCHAKAPKSSCEFSMRCLSYSGDLRELMLWMMQGTDVSADLSLGPGVLCGAEPMARLHWEYNTNEKSTVIIPNCWDSREIDCRSLA